MNGKYSSLTFKLPSNLTIAMPYIMTRCNKEFLVIYIIYYMYYTRTAHRRPTERGSKNLDLALLGKIKLKKEVCTVELLEFSGPVKAI